MTEPRPFKAAVCVLLALAVTGCTRVPEIEDRLTADLHAANYPELLPLEQNLVPLPPPQEQSDQLEQNLDARSERLKARAQALRRAQI